MAPRELRNTRNFKISISNKVLKVDNPPIVLAIANIVDITKGERQLPQPPHPLVVGARNVLQAFGQTFKIYLIGSVILVILSLLLIPFLGERVGSFIGSILSLVFNLFILYKLALEMTKIIKEIHQKILHKKPLPTIIYNICITTNKEKFKISDVQRSRRDLIYSELCNVMEKPKDPVNFNITIDGDFTGDFINQNGNFNTGFIK